MARLIEYNYPTSPYRMDAEMQAEQERLTIALNKEETAYNTYKEKMNRWKTRRNTNALEIEPREKQPGAIFK